MVMSMVCPTVQENWPASQQSTMDDRQGMAGRAHISEPYKCQSVDPEGSFQRCHSLASVMAGPWSPKPDESI